jgi:hypothetical protein
VPTLAAGLAGAPSVGTLYIPPLVERPVEDAELLEVMLAAGAQPAGS